MKSHNQYNDTQHNYTQHNKAYHTDTQHGVKHNYNRHTIHSEHGNTKPRGILSVVILSGITQRDTVFSVIMLRVNTFNVVMLRNYVECQCAVLTDVMLCVIMLSDTILSVPVLTLSI